MPIDTRLARRTFLRGIGVAGSIIRLGLPPLEAMFNSNGTAYAQGVSKAIPKRVRVLVQRQRHSREVLDSAGDGRRTTADAMCLRRWRRMREDVHIISGLDNAGAEIAGSGKRPLSVHERRWLPAQLIRDGGAGGPSIDQAIAQKIGGNTRFRSLQVGVCQESFGESIQRNMSWADRDRPLPPEMIPHRLFDRLFGVKDAAWVTGRRVSWMP